MRAFLGCAACFLALGLAAAAASAAPPAEADGWATGKTLHEQLRQPVTVTWSNTPLLVALESLAASQRVAIMLDRRVDPDRPVTLTLSREALEQALRAIAEHCQLGYSQFGSVAYFGPTETTRRLRTLGALRLEDVRTLGPAAVRKFLMLRAWHWDELAEPRTLLAQLAEEAQVAIDGADQIPHDLWREVNLPPLSWIDRLTLLAAQFGLTYQFTDDARRVKLVEAPAKPTLARSYRAGPDAAAVVRRWAKALPGALVAVEDKKIRVEGLLEDHDAIEQRLRGTPTQRATVTAGKEEYQLTVNGAALDQVVDQMARQLNLQFEWDREAIDAAGIATDQLVSVKIQNASLDELLTAVLRDTGLTFRRAERTVSILPTGKR